MGAKQNHRTAGNSYNFCSKVEIPIEVQLHNELCYIMNYEFASQPEPGQSCSKSDFDTSIDLEIDTLVTHKSEDSFKESPVLCKEKNTKNIR